MSNLGQAIHKQAAKAFKEKDKTTFRLHSQRFLELLKDVDTLLRTRPEFNFDRWLTQARVGELTPEEQDLYEKDATALFTIWGAMTKTLSSLVTVERMGRTDRRLLSETVGEVLCHA